MKTFYLTIFLIIIETIRAQTQQCTNTYGNQLKGECKLVDDCPGAALKGNCSTNFVCCIADKPKTIAENKYVTQKLFLEIVNNTARNRAMYGYFVESMNLAGVSDSIYKAAAYFSQLVGESNYFKNLESNLVDADLNNELGNNETGDGTKYQGRGAILLRGKTNYLLANSKAPNLGVNIVANPEQVAFPSVAFKVAAWFWTKNSYVVTTNEPAKQGDLSILADGTYHNFTLLTYALTNNLQKLRERTDLYERVVSRNGFGTLKRGSGVGCEIGSKQGFSVPICLVGVNKPYCGCEGEYETRSCPYGFYSNNKCRGSSVLKCCIEKCNSALDLVILMDSSGSIGINDFKKEQAFVNALISKLKIGENDTRVAVMHYNTKPYIVASFQSLQTFASIQSLVNGINYNGGNTYTGDALALANQNLLQESNGMRPIEFGIPKVVVVITDGQSQLPQKTLDEAKKIKDRGFSVLSVGVGNGVNFPELIGIASTPADQYFVTDFDKIQIILSGLSRTTCQQPAPIPSETEIIAEVPKNSYKYYKFSLDNAINNNTNETLRQFTLELSLFSGDSELFFSFEDENPKSKDEFLDPSTIKPEADYNFVERLTQRFRRNSVIEDQQKVKKRKLYQVTRPEEGQNKTLYFSVKGLGEQNEFKVYVYNRVVNSAKSLWFFDKSKVLLVLLLSLSFNLVLLK